MGCCIHVYNLWGNWVYTVVYITTLVMEKKGSNTSVSLDSSAKFGYQAVPKDTTCNVLKRQ